MSPRLLAPAPRGPLLESRASSARIDQVLLNASQAGQQAAFRIPMVLTEELWIRITGEVIFDPSDFRLEELAWFLRFALLKAGFQSVAELGKRGPIVFGAAFDSCQGPAGFPIQAHFAAERVRPCLVLQLAD